MIVRKATSNDYRKLSYHIRNKHIDYITVSHIAADIESNSLFVLEDNNTLVAMVSVVWQEEFQCCGIKRLVIFNKKNHGKGYASLLLNEVIEKGKKYSVTPWIDNTTMHHLLAKLGFHYVKTFNKIWTLWEKNA